MRSVLLLPLSLILVACAAAPRPASFAAASGRGDPAALLDRADADHDGRVTQAEFLDARQKLFDRLDRDGDGYLSSNDAPRRPGRRAMAGQRLAQVTAGLDRDGDGRVSRAEFGEGPSRLFQRADRNGDGVIDASELSALRASPRP